MAIQVPEQESADQLVPKRQKMLINGEWVDAASGRTFETTNPATEELLAEVPYGDAEDVDRAVRAAREAFETGPWSQMNPADREMLIRRLADLLEENTEEFARLESLDNGKPVMWAQMVDVASSVSSLRYMAGWATKIEGSTINPSPMMPGFHPHMFTLKEPVGVVAQIIPWNFPLLMAAWKVGPALATGCTVVLKPAEQTPLTALRLGQLIQEAGFPKGVVNIVTGDEVAGAALVVHPGVDKVAFTGSTEVGKSIIQSAAGNLKKVSLELGGKSPNIVFADADMGTSIFGAANAIFFNQGQVCTAGSRLYVESSVFDDVVSGVADIAKSMKIGPGLDPTTQIGPLVSSDQLNRVSGYLDTGKSEGARTVVGGKRHGDTGYFVEPTIFADTNPNMRIVQEEIFGPVLTAIPFDDPAELMKEANGTQYGLAAGIWTRDISKAHLTARQLKAGTVWINCYGMLDNGLPFGGYKQSGWGRENGRDGIELYLQTKSVVIGL